MSRPKKPRAKAYRQRPVSFNGGLFSIAQKHAAIEDSKPIQGEDQTDLSTAYWLAFDAMLRSSSREEDWCVVVCALNVAMVLTERGFGTDFEPDIIKALDGAFRASIRAGHTGKWRFDGEAINAIREALFIHDQQIELATKEEMRSALKEVHSRIDSGMVYREAA